MPFAFIRSSLHEIIYISLYSMSDLFTGGCTIFLPLAFTSWNETSVVVKENAMVRCRRVAALQIPSCLKSTVYNCRNSRKCEEIRSFAIQKLKNLRYISKIPVEIHDQHKHFPRTVHNLVPVKFLFKEPYTGYYLPNSGVESLMLYY